MSVSGLFALMAQYDPERMKKLYTSDLYRFINPSGYKEKKRLRRKRNRLRKKHTRKRK